MKATDDKLLLIRNYDLWAHMSDEDYQELNVVSSFIEVPKGQYIYFEAYHHNKLYFLKKGYIRIGFINDQGEEVIREIIREGETFGQLTLERNNLHGEFAQAYKTNVSLCAFNIEDFQKMLHNKPEVALRFSKQVGHKLKHIENRLINLLNKDVRTRLLSFFCQLAEQYPEGINGNVFSMANFLTHEDIAHLIGSSRQTVTTLINELTDEGLIIFDRKHISFPDVKMLQKRMIVV